MLGIVVHDVLVIIVLIVCPMYEMKMFKTLWLSLITMLS
jgi:hypothetical protein